MIDRMQDELERLHEANQRLLKAVEGLEETMREDAQELKHTREVSARRSAANAECLGCLGAIAQMFPTSVAGRLARIGMEEALKTVRGLAEEQGASEKVDKYRPEVALD